jgi:hypothetical protein
MRFPKFALSFAMLTVVLPISSRADDSPPKQDAKKVEPKAADSDAPLPEGFPDATRPGVVEIKTYPAYRSAVARVEKATTNSGNMMFFPLFNHIQKNNVEMTAPVINTFKTPKMVETPGAKGEVTMEFLYRSTKQGKTGRDNAMIEVVDHPEQKFVCLGFQGDMSDAEMRDGVGTLNKWLEENKAEWVENGPPRRLGYHSPMTPVAQRLWEVQIPVKAAK